MNETRAQRFDLFADYFQFYLQDEGATGDLSNSWGPEAVERLLAIAPGVIGVGTVRNMTVPVEVEIAGQEPPPDYEGWDRVNECSIHVSSGRLVIAGCTDYLPDAARIAVTPGSYRARVYYRGLSTVSANGLEGEDFYRVVLWPAPPSAVHVHKAGSGV